MTNRPITYQIRRIAHDEYELVSIVPTPSGSIAINFVAVGTQDHCERIKAKLEKMK